MAYRGQRHSDIDKLNTPKPARIKKSVPGQDIVAQDIVSPESAYLHSVSAHGKPLSPTDILTLQQTAGNQAVQRLLVNRRQQQSPAGGQVMSVIQPRLTVSSPDDIYEQEADRVSEMVTRSINSQVRRQAEPEEEEEEEVMPEVAAELQRQAEPGEEEEKEVMPEVAAELQRQAEPEEEEEEEEVMPKVAAELQRQAEPEEEEEEEVMPEVAAEPQRQAEPEEEEELQGKLQLQVTKVVPEVTPETESNINVARGSGEPLNDDIRKPMEKAFGADFSKIRLHNDANADALNQSLQARAFTTGQDIFFRSGEYNPANSSGRQLLAHELTHTIQQGSAPIVSSRKGKTPFQDVAMRDKEDFEKKRKNLEEFFANKQKEQKGGKQAPGETSESGITGVEQTGQKTVEEPFKNDPTQGMDKTVYDQALTKFKKMKKPRILGGASKATRRFDALNYLRETVEASRKYTSHTQMIINSVMEAYQDTFGEELKEDKAQEKLGTKDQEKVTTWQKIKAFYSYVMHLKKWVDWIKEFIKSSKKPTEEVAETASKVTLPQFLSFAQPIADKMSSWVEKMATVTKWLPIVGFVMEIFKIIKAVPGVIKKAFDMFALRSAAKSAEKKQESASTELAEAAQYGYAKVKRGFWSQFFGLMKSVAQFVLGVAKFIIGAVSGGVGAIVTEAISFSLTLVEWCTKFYRKTKGFFKWIFGIRGKGRRENAEKIVMSARDGSEEALTLLLKLGPSGMFRGDKLDKFWYRLRYWGSEKKSQDKKMLTNILKDWDKKEIDTLVKGVAEKLKSQ